MFCVYVIRSVSSGKLYKGSTDNLERRLIEHNKTGANKYYTSNKGPWELVYLEKYETRAEAMARENFFKSGKGRLILKEILSVQQREN